MKVFADAFKTRGGTWIDSAVGGYDDARASALSRIAGGNPPSALLDNIGDVQALAEQGVLSPLDPAAAAAATAHMPGFLMSKVSREGKVFAIPVDIGQANWTWYSTKAFHDIGAPPPATWDEFFVDAKKLKEKGYIPLAFGGQPWQQAGLFYNIMLSVGRDFYKKVLVDRDVTAAGGPEMVKTFETMRKLTAYVDPGSPGRKWNDAANLVITNKAAMQVMGDWAKGEFIAAGLTLGKDYDCALAPGTQDAFLMVVDLFDFPTVTAPEMVKGQKLLRDVLIDPAVQVAFSKVKGSLPSRLDVDVSGLDSCLQKGEKILADPQAQVPNFEFVFTADEEGQVKDLVSKFWSDPGMTAVDAARQFSQIVGETSK
ncbi:MAG: ABC transporter substrate-binding protein [Azospirillaceae bacterium]|nr:ABC transporter substrate-binding protein [Azospirillaceae bacterium]